MKNEIYRSPWFELEGYLACTVQYDDGSKKTVLCHREILEQKLGRPILPGCVSHHIDGNKKNNDPSNLQEKTNSDHAREHRKKPETTAFNCPECGVKFVAISSVIKHNQTSQKKSGPFCGKQCAGRWSQKKKSSTMSFSTKNIEDLRSGKSVKTRLHGNSMKGRIESGSLVTIEPAKIEDIRVDDIVYCRVNGNVYAHLCIGVGPKGCLIANNKGHVNGWTRTVFGKIVAVEK